MRTPNTLIKYTEISGPPESTLHQCTGALNVHSSLHQCIFSAALKIPSSLCSVLHCKYPETTLNPHSTSIGESYLYKYTHPAYRPIGLLQAKVVAPPTEPLVHLALT